VTTTVLITSTVSTTVSAAGASPPVAAGVGWLERQALRINASTVIKPNTVISLRVMFLSSSLILVSVEMADGVKIPHLI